MIFSYSATLLIDLLINDRFLRLYAIQINFSPQINTHLSLLKNYDVSMVQSNNCIIILGPIPSLPEPPFLTALISSKLSCRLSPLRNTGYPMRKLTIHCGNRSPIKRLSRNTISYRCYTKRNFQSKSHSQKREMLLGFTNPSTPTFLHPSKCQSP